MTDEVFNRLTRRMDIGKAIVTIRKARGMTQKELAKRCGMSQNAIVMIERNYSHPPMATLNKLQEALDIPQSMIYLCSIEDCDFPEDKRILYKLQLVPMRDCLLSKD